jgi:hypothetical protein
MVETPCLSREEYRLRAFKSTVLRKIFAHKRGNVPEGRI